MATTKEYKDFILEKLNLLDDIKCRSMMGEFLLYYQGILFGGIYDDRLLIKMVNSNEKFNLLKEIPYPGAKAMYFVKNLNDKEFLKEIVCETCKSLKKLRACDTPL